MSATPPSPAGAPGSWRAPLLSVDENAVVCLRLGLDGEEPRTVEEIAMVLGFTRQRIRRLERSAVGKLSGHEGFTELVEALDVVHSADLR